MNTIATEAAPTLLQNVANWGGAIAAAGGAGLMLLRRASRARPELAKDAAERDFVQLLLKERDAALQAAEAARQALQTYAEALGVLKAENAALSRDVQRLREDFSKFQRKLLRVYPEVRGYLDSNVIPWEDPSKPTAA